MSLPETLAALSDALQSGGGRIRVIKQGVLAGGIGPTSTLYVVCRGRFSRLGLLEPAKHADDPAEYAPWLEAALREEIEARGWLWRVWALPPGCGGYGAELERGVLTGTTLEYAPTPAEALASALLRALKGPS